MCNISQKSEQYTLYMNMYTVDTKIENRKLLRLCLMVQRLKIAMDGTQKWMVHKNGQHTEMKWIKMPFDIYNHHLWIFSFLLLFLNVEG